MMYNIIREFCKRPLARVYTEMYSRGRRGAPAKGVGRVTGARVQISPSPPEKSQVERLGFFQLNPPLAEEIHFVDEIASR